MAKPLRIPILRRVAKAIPGVYQLFGQRRTGAPTILDPAGQERPLVALRKGSMVLGDLLYWAGSTYRRLPIGSDDQVLTADSSEAAGLKWAASGGGGGGSSDPVWSDATYRQYRWNANIGGQSMVGAGYGDMAGGASGGTSGIIVSTGGVVQRRTNTNANNGCGFRVSGSTSNPLIELQWSPRLEIRFRTYSDISNCVMFIGMYKNNGTVNNDLTKSDNRAGISYVSGTDTYWQLDESDGTTRTKTATSVTPAVDTVYRFLFAYNDATGAIDVSINGSSVGSMSTNLPPASNPLGIWLWSTTISSGTRAGIQASTVTLKVL